MGTKKTLGGDRLGAGKRMQVELNAYERSTHNLGYLWRSSMAPGTLVPFMVEPALPGDTWDIGLGADVKTLPTVGPLFGSFKLQLDVFQVPIRLYQAQLHNNKLYIGMKMENIKLPKLQIITPRIDFNSDIPAEWQQIDQSSLLSYIGIRGIGNRNIGQPDEYADAEFDATAYISIFDIYKNYYANKQEEIGAMIHTEPWKASNATIWQVNGDRNGNFTNGEATINPYELLRTVDAEMYIGVSSGTIKGDPYNIKIILEYEGKAKTYNITDVFDKIHETATGYRYSLYKLQNDTNLYKILLDLEKPDTIKPKIVTFPLSNLDDMREDILAAIKSTTPFIINKNTYAPYGLPLKYEENTYLSASGNTMEGLLLKTYQSDIFNNWLQTEWIDGENGISAITSIDTSEGKFSIDTLNLAKKVYKLLNRIAVSGGSYDDWIEAAYDIEPARKAETPMYMGGLSKEVVFQEVVSNSASEQTLDGNTEPLGTLGGRGVMSNKNKGGKCVIKVNEHSYLIGIVSLTPRIDYSQGNRWFTRINNMNDWHKPALDQIGFQDLITEQMAFWDVQPNNKLRSAGKQPAWINYMTNFNRCYGNFAHPNKEMFMTLNRRYEANPAGTIRDLTTYIDPSKYNYAFASTNLDSQNFWVQIAIDAEVRRKMSAKIMPNP